MSILGIRAQLSQQARLEDQVQSVRRVNRTREELANQEHRITNADRTSREEEYMNRIKGKTKNPLRVLQGAGVQIGMCGDGVLGSGGMNGGEINGLSSTQRGKAIPQEEKELMYARAMRDPIVYAAISRIIDYLVQVDIKVEQKINDVRYLSTMFPPGMPADQLNDYSKRERNKKYNNSGLYSDSEDDDENNNNTHMSLGKGPINHSAIIPPPMQRARKDDGKQLELYQPDSNSSDAKNKKKSGSNENESDGEDGEVSGGKKKVTTNDKDTTKDSVTKHSSSDSKSDMSSSETVRNMPTTTTSSSAAATTTQPLQQPKGKKKLTPAQLFRTTQPTEETEEYARIVFTPLVPQAITWMMIYGMVPYYIAYEGNSNRRIPMIPSIEAVNIGIVTDIENFTTHYVCLNVETRQVISNMYVYAFNRPSPMLHFNSPVAAIVRTCSQRDFMFNMSLQLDADRAQNYIYTTREPRKDLTDAVAGTYQDESLLGRQAHSFLLTRGMDSGDTMAFEDEEDEKAKAVGINPPHRIRCADNTRIVNPTWPQYRPDILDQDMAVQEKIAAAFGIPRSVLTSNQKFAADSGADLANMHARALSIASDLEKLFTEILRVTYDYSDSLGISLKLKSIISMDNVLALAERGLISPGAEAELALSAANIPDTYSIFHENERLARAARKPREATWTQGSAIGAQDKLEAQQAQVQIEMTKAQIETEKKTAKEIGNPQPVAAAAPASAAAPKPKASAPAPAKSSSSLSSSSGSHDSSSGSAKKSDAEKAKGRSDKAKSDKDDTKEKAASDSKDAKTKEQKDESDSKKRKESDSKEKKKESDEKESKKAKTSDSTEKRKDEKEKSESEKKRERDQGKKADSGKGGDAESKTESAKKGKDSDAQKKKKAKGK